MKPLEEMKKYAADHLPDVNQVELHPWCSSPKSSTSAGSASPSFRSFHRLSGGLTFVVKRDATALCCRSFALSCAMKGIRTRRFRGWPRSSSRRRPKSCSGGPSKKSARPTPLWNSAPFFINDASIDELKPPSRPTRSLSPSATRTCSKRKAQVRAPGSTRQTLCVFSPGIFSFSSNSTLDSASLGRESMRRCSRPKSHVARRVPIWP